MRSGKLNSQTIKSEIMHGQTMKSEIIHDQKMNTAPFVNGKCTNIFGTKNPNFCSRKFLIANVTGNNRVGSINSAEPMVRIRTQKLGTYPK